MLNRLNNAEPVIKGQCCDMCNTLIVIPARLRESGSNEIEVSNYLNSLLTPTPEKPEKLPLVGITTKINDFTATESWTCPQCEFECKVSRSRMDYHSSKDYGKYQSFVDHMNAKKNAQYIARNYNRDRQGPNA